MGRKLIAVERRPAVRLFPLKKSTWTGSVIFSIATVSGMVGRTAPCMAKGEAYGRLSPIFLAVGGIRQNKTDVWRRPNWSGKTDAGIKHGLGRRVFLTVFSCYIWKQLPVTLPILLAAAKRQLANWPLFNHMVQANKKTSTFCIPSIFDSACVS